jgi:cytochrome bd-type quinol oxidase subunit 2
VRPRWSGLLVCVVLALCGAAYFPLRTDGASTTVQAVAFGASGLCLLLALLAAFRANTAVLAAAVVVPAVLAAAQLLEGRLRSPGLTQALDGTTAPPWAAGSVAALAALVSLVALLVHLAPRWVPDGSRQPARPEAEVSRN